MECGISWNIPGHHQHSKERGDQFSGKSKSNSYEQHNSNNATLPFHPYLSVDQLKHLPVCHKYLSSFKISIEISNYMFRKCSCVSPTAKPSVRKAGNKKAALGLWDGWPPWGWVCDWVFALLGFLGSCRRFISYGGQGLCVAHVWLTAMDLLDIQLWMNLKAFSSQPQESRECLTSESSCFEG